MSSVKTCYRSGRSPRVVVGFSKPDFQTLFTHNHTIISVPSGRDSDAARALITLGPLS